MLLETIGLFTVKIIRTRWISNNFQAFLNYFQRTLRSSVFTNLVPSHWKICATGKTPLIKKASITKIRCAFFCLLCVRPLEPHLADFQPYGSQSPYAWETLSPSYKLRQMSFSPTVLQHASNLYSTNINRSPQPQQPLDCSTHYSPSSNTYHCITCDKVGTAA